MQQIHKDFLTLMLQLLISSITIQVFPYPIDNLSNFFAQFYTN